MIFRIKFPTKCIFWICLFGKLTEIRGFVAYLSNYPRTYTCVPVTEQYNLVSAEWGDFFSCEVTAGLVESNSSLPPGL